MEILLKNVAEQPQNFDGPRYLIESTWPKNVQDLDVAPYRWVKELVPSYELAAMAQRQRWSKEHFQHAYWAELERLEAQRALQKLFGEDTGRVTFLYAAPSSLKTSAYYLKRYISAHSSFAA